MGKSNNEALIRRIQTRLAIDLHPSKLASVSTGVHEHLNGLLLKYNENLNGVVLAYSDEKVLSQTALVHPYFPLARLVVSATLIVFRPCPGARLTGIVNKLSDDFIGLVVMGFMNVVIKAPDVRSDLKSPAFGSNAWVSSKDPSHSITVGDSVAFRVVEVKHEGTYVTLTGSLKEKDTGNVTVVGVATAAEVTKKDEKGGKKKAGKRKKEEEESDHSDDDEEDIVVQKDVLENGANEDAEVEKEEAAGKKKKKSSAGVDGDKKKRRKEEEKEKEIPVEKESSKRKTEGEEGEGKDSKANKKEKKEKKRRKGGDGD